VVQCVAVWCSVLQCVAVCCRVVQCVAVIISVMRKRDVIFFRKEITSSLLTEEIRIEIFGSPDPTGFPLVQVSDGDSHILP